MLKARHQDIITLQSSFYVVFISPSYSVETQREQIINDSVRFLCHLMQTNSQSNLDKLVYRKENKISGTRGEGRKKNHALFSPGVCKLEAKEN